MMPAKCQLLYFESAWAEEAEILMVSADPAAALLIKGGLVLQPQLYLRQVSVLAVLHQPAAGSIDQYICLHNSHRVLACVHCK